MKSIKTLIVIAALLLPLPAALHAAEAPVIGNLRVTQSPPEVDKLGEIAEKGTAAQLKAFLKKNRKFTELELNGAYTRAMFNQNDGVREVLIKAGADPRAGGFMEEDVDQSGN